MVWLAQRTKDAIDAALVADGGNAYRKRLEQVLPHIRDIYREEPALKRSINLGAGSIGGACERAVAYGYRWAHPQKPRAKKGESDTTARARMTRLLNRGHMEEARFIALLLAAGIQVFQQDANGRQYGMRQLNGHLRGFCDGVVLGIPDLPAGVPANAEFKTHGSKSYAKLVELGVREAKPEHYVQMQLYMADFGLQYGVYFATNKDTDELYIEIVMYDGKTDAAYIERARRIVFGDKMPERIRNASPGNQQCKFLCDYPLVCFGTVQPARSCRTCRNGFAMPDGTWQCAPRAHTLTKQEQMDGCGAYEFNVEAFK